MSRERVQRVYLEKEPSARPRPQARFPWAVVAFWGGSLLVATLFETAFFPALPLFGAVPHVTLLVVVGAALAGGEREGAWVGLAAGLLADLFDGVYVGQGAARAFLGYVVGRSRRRFFSDQPLVPGLLIFFTAMADGLLRLVVPTAFGAGLPWFALWRRHEPAASLYTLLVAPVFLNLLARGRRRAGSAGGLGN